MVLYAASMCIVLVGETVICSPDGEASHLFFDEGPPWARVPPEELEMEPDESSEAVGSKTTTSACQQSVLAEAVPFVARCRHNLIYPST